MTTVSSLPVRLAGIVRDAIAVLARLGPRGLATGPVLVAIHACLQRRLLRFARLMARVAAGRVTPRSAETQPVTAELAEHPARQERPKRARRRASQVPRGFAWAVRMAQETAV